MESILVPNIFRHFFIWDFITFADNKWTLEKEPYKWKSPIRSPFPCEGHIFKPKKYNNNDKKTWFYCWLITADSNLATERGLDCCHWPIKINTTTLCVIKAGKNSFYSLDGWFLNNVSIVKVLTKYIYSCYTK